jgi:hypothetical protein
MPAARCLWIAGSLGWGVCVALNSMCLCAAFAAGMLSVACAPCCEGKCQDVLLHCAAGQCCMVCGAGLMCCACWLAFWQKKCLDGRDRGYPDAVHSLVGFCRHGMSGLSVWACGFGVIADSTLLTTDGRLLWQRVGCWCAEACWQ